ncbi:putative iron ascorbate-dependent oxidoreductase family protein [Lyophyllum shimeji]|uniref:Iron ascorbate-dependent oxidoreductase family protein n=1 Tax=Lyophyllum shimeji TaxID=47721 RepID=A0A9P3PMS9_LYOSH|nr:putative iron ascorbate-dependent oxidoreductase family protein [Lyophyllum shimeji]
MTENVHPDFPQNPAPGFLLASQRTESTFEEIPVIDFTDARSSDASKRRALAELILHASVNVGFFYLKNHGMSEKRITGALEAGKAFFALDTSTKMELDIGKSSNFKGYTALLQENVNPAGLGDLHEGFDIGWEPELPSDEDAHTARRITDAAMSGANVWPSNFPGFKEAVLAYYHDAVRLGKLLFPLFALALGLQEDFFDDKITRPAAIMRLLHYPPQPRHVNVEGRQIGIGEHTDYECFTLLWQDPVGGLQVRNAAGKWIDAVHIPGTLVVNLGDQFARWTNDVFKSTPHRAINRSGEERYSIPVFFGTDYDVPLEPISTCVSPENPAKYEVITAGAYVKSRLDATYANHAN